MMWNKLFFFSNRYRSFQMPA